MEVQDPSKLLVTRNEAAKQIGISTSTVDRLMYERRLAYIKLGGARNGSVRISQAAIDEFLASHTVEAATTLETRNVEVQPAKRKVRRSGKTAR